MLVITRRKDESLLIGDDIEIKIVKVEDGSVRLAISAPRDITILRKEVFERVKEENEKRLEEEESVLSAERESEEEKTLEEETASKEERISERQNERMESGRYLENGFQIQQKDIILMSVLGIRCENCGN